MLETPQLSLPTATCRCCIAVGSEAGDQSCVTNTNVYLLVSDAGHQRPVAAADIEVTSEFPCWCASTDMAAVVTQTPWAFVQQLLRPVPSCFFLNARNQAMDTSEASQWKMSTWICGPSSLHHINSKTFPRRPLLLTSIALL